MTGKRIKILLIEDNPGDVRLMREMLGEANGAKFDLESADRLERGLKRLAEGGIDLVFLDLGLPDSHGIYTFLKLKSQVQKVPIVVLTGIEDETLGINAVRSGAQDYLVKGEVNGNLLVHIIRYAIERKQAELALHESEEIYMSLVKYFPDAVTVTDLDTTIIEVSQQTLILHGFRKAEELLGRSILELIAPEEHVKAISSFQEAMKKGLVRDVEYTLLRKDGTCFISELNVSLIKDANGEPKGFIAITRGIKGRGQVEETFSELAYYDSLTGLLNRRGFSILAQQELKIANRTKRNMLLLSVNFDNLKSIKQNLGQHKGDEALIEISNLLKETFHDSEIIARVGRDKFAVLAIVTHRDNIANITTNLKKTIEAHNKKEKRASNLSISLATAFFDPKSPCSVDELISRADKFMYKPKKKKKNS